MALKIIKLPFSKSINFLENLSICNPTKFYCSSTKNTSKKYKENLSVVLHSINNMKIETRPIPKITPTQVLLQMEVIGICGSDVHYLTHGKIGSFVVKDPMVIGHEGSGTVLECGECVTSLKPGDKVAIEPYVYVCRKCIYCKTGNYHLCPNLTFCATPPQDGNLCRYYAHEADFCHKLPCNMDLEHGALMEPLAVAVHACKRGKLTCGDTVLVLGAGPIGLMSFLAAQAYGASKVIITDIDNYKLDKAAELGVYCAFNVKDMAVKDVIKLIKSINDGELPNKTMECTGTESAFEMGFLATRTGGKLILVGGGEMMPLPVHECIYREVDIVGVCRYGNDYPTAIDMVTTRKFDPKPLITHHFRLEDSLKAFEMASKKTENYVKILLHANPKWKQ